MKKENFKKNEKNKNKKIKISPPKTTTTTTIAWRYHHFTQVYQKSWSYAILFLRYMACDGCSCYFSFWAIFLPFYLPNSPKNQNFKKNKTKKTHTHRHTHNTKQTKNTWRFDLTHVYQKLWLDEAWFLRYGARQTDRQTDRKSGI